MKKDLKKCDQVPNTEYITLKKLSEETGVGHKYLQALCRNGILPHSRPQGKIIYVSRWNWNNWLDENKVKTAKEIESEAATIVTLKSLKK